MDQLFRYLELGLEWEENGSFLPSCLCLYDKKGVTVYELEYDLVFNIIGVFYIYFVGNKFFLTEASSLKPNNLLTPVFFSKICLRRDFLCLGHFFHYFAPAPAPALCSLLKNGKLFGSTK